MSNIRLIGVIIAGVFFFTLLDLRVNNDLLAILLVAVILLISIRDRRYLLVGWFIISPYFYPLGVKGGVNIASNLSHNLFVPFIAVVTWASTLLRRGRLVLGKEDACFLAFILYMVFSSFFALGGPYEDLRAIYTVYLVPFLLYLIVKNIRIDSHILAGITYASIFHLVVLLLMCSFEFQTGRSLYTKVLLWKDVGMGRIAGPFGSPIILGLYVSLLLLYGYAGFRLKFISLLNFTLIAIVSTFLCILTFTRSVWLGLLISAVYLTLKVPTKSTVRLIGFLGLAAFVALLATYLLSFPQVAERISEPRDVQFRLVMAYASIRMFANSPIVGSGFGTFDHVMPNYLTNMFGLHILNDTSHVTLLTWLAELGIVGLLLFFGFLYWSLSAHGLKLRYMRFSTQVVMITNFAFILSFATNAFLIDMRFFSLAYSWFFISLGMIQNVYKTYDLGTE